MRRALLLAALLALATASASHGATTRAVSIHGNAFDPRTIHVIVGDNVRWTNHDFGPHDIRSDDGTSFASGDLARLQTFTTPNAFMTPGLVLYHCNRHSYMHGTIDVDQIWLATPGMATFGGNATFTGLAQPSATVHIQKGGVDVVTPVVANAASGAFTAFVPAIPGAYVAFDGTYTSTPATHLRVKPKLTITKRKVRRGVWSVVVKAAPNQKGATAILDKRKGYGWAKLASKTFGPVSKAAFTVRIPATKSQLRVRIRLTHPKNGYSPATSASFLLKR